MFSFLKKTVSVTFVDDASGCTFASSEMPINRLPDTFAIDTNLDIAGQPYVVVRAEPQTKAAFAKTKRLTVTLRRVESIDPKQILFSLPSLCNSALPAVEPSDGMGSVHVLHEDDWRQCEFVSMKYTRDLSTELAAIRHIHATAAVAAGWREIHVRDRIPSPLIAGTRWTDVGKQLAPLDPGPRITLGDARHAVSGAVAGQFSDGVVVWGVEKLGELSVLCVENVEAASEATITQLKRASDALSLVLVNWCKCQAYAPGVFTVEGAIGCPWDR